MNSPIKDKVGALSVINPEFDQRVVYRHFVDDLGFKSMNFLLQDYNYDNPPPYDPKVCGSLLRNIFAEWIKDNDPKINISFFTSLINLFKEKHSLIYGIGAQLTSSLPILTIASNGDLSPVDELRNTDIALMHNQNVANVTFKEFLNSQYFDTLRNAFEISPSKCQTCCWEKICKGGGIVNRYCSTNRFDNPSIYCEGLKEIYSTMAAFILKSGYPLSEMQEKLLG